MRKVSVRKFRQNLASELQKLPFELTKRNKSIAVVYALGVEKSVHNPNVHKEEEEGVHNEANEDMDKLREGAFSR